MTDTKIDLDQKWHAKTVDDTFSALDSTPQGLSQEQAQLRLELYGPNQLPESDKRSRLIRFFCNLIIYSSMF